MSTFPRYILKKGQSVLDLFCAAFQGGNTLAHVKGLCGSYVGLDNDAEKLQEVMKNNPETKLDFICGDSYRIVEDLIKEGRQFDVVISDQWTNQNRTVYSLLPEIIKLSKKYVIISTNIEHMKALPMQIGEFNLEGFWWRSVYLKGTYWAIYVK
jgi:2-polyprenyl-3-methyl-5-hydroxy-6-metoxy-1,4-benzoquinol methylase